MSVKLEICAGGIDDAIAAVKGSADRIELCSALSEGGLTPSAAAVGMAAELPIPVNVLIRPRSGDFIYSAAEAEMMERDIRFALESGVSGVVVGALTADGDVDIPLCRRLVGAAREVNQDADLTFHRAFDLVASPFDAIEKIVELGFHRVLTSGQASTALKGAELISELKEHVERRILLMAGAGVNPANAADIIRLSHADELHASARSLLSSQMVSYPRGVCMGSSDTENGSRLITDASIVKSIKNAIDCFS